MTTRISVDLPADLLEAANLNQYRNRTRLATRENGSKFKQDALKQVELLPAKDKKDLYKGAVPEYRQSIALSKTSNIDFGWLIVEESCKNLTYSNTVDACQQTRFNGRNIDYDYSFAAGTRVSSGSRYFKDSQISYMRGVDYSHEGTSGPGFPLPPPIPDSEKIKLNRANFSGLGVSTSTALNNIDRARFVEFTISKQLKNIKSNIFTGFVNCPGGIVIDTSNSFQDFDHYMLNLYFSIAKTNGAGFLYVVWKTTGNESSGNGFDNGLRILERDGVSLNGYGRRLAVTWWTKNGEFAGGMPFVGATRKQSYQDYRVFSEELLPENLRGFMTAIFEINPNIVSNPYQLIPKLTFFAKPEAQLNSNSPYGSETATISLNEKFLIAISGRNYAAT